ncbi:hypothetical protein [Malaciobacter mytili]|uniref:hypothetical protein n=1 Tax=Malaciobacter mytili TaxID=603050 RepID=UPI003A83A2C3
MKELTTYYTKKNILFKNISLIEPKVLGSRKKIEIYTATDIKSSYWAIFKIDTKSRFIRKNAQELLELYEKLKEYKDHNFKYKELVITSPLCSKAKTFLQENDWRVRVDFM